MSGNGFSLRVPKIASQTKDGQLYETLKDMVQKVDDQFAKCMTSTDIIARLDEKAPYFDDGIEKFSVKAYGALGDGIADDTLAVLLTVAAASAVMPRGVVFFPPGTYNVIGAFDLNNLDGLSIIGSGVGTTIIRITHATNDLFSTSSAETENLTIRSFSVYSDTVTRTAGWVFRVNNAYNGAGVLKRSMISDIECRDQFNGFWIAKYEFVSCKDLMFWKPSTSTTGIGFKAGQTTASNINQGSELYLAHVQVYGNDLAGGSPSLANSFVIEDTDAVYMFMCGSGGVYGGDLKIISNAGGHGPSNLFFDMCVFDATKTNACVNVTGGGSHDRYQFVNCWIASSGALAGGTATACGILLDTTGVITFMKVVGSTFYNCKGNGLRVGTGTHVTLIVSANHFDYCGIGGTAGYKAAIYVNTPAGSLAPSITSNYEANSGLYWIESTNTSDKLYVSSNRNLTATSYGISPMGIWAGVYTPTLTGVANVQATSGPTAHFTRVDNVVYVGGYCQIDVTAGGAATKLGISLPIASNLAAASDLSGHGNRDTGAMIYGRIIGDAANDRAELQFYADADAFNRDTYFSFSYIVK